MFDLGVCKQHRSLCVCDPNDGRTQCGDITRSRCSYGHRAAVEPPLFVTEAGFSRRFPSPSLARANDNANHRLAHRSANGHENENVTPSIFLQRRTGVTQSTIASTAVVVAWESDRVGEHPAHPCPRRAVLFEAITGTTVGESIATASLGHDGRCSTEGVCSVAPNSTAPRSIVAPYGLRRPRRSSCTCAGPRSNVPRSIAGLFVFKRTLRTISVRSAGVGGMGSIRGSSRTTPGSSMGRSSPWRGTVCPPFQYKL